MKACIHVCDTCYHLQQPAGEELLERVREAAADSERATEFEVRAVTCLMACSQGCNASVQAPDKAGYVVGRFDASETSATAIVELMEKVLASNSRELGHMDLPGRMARHVIARTPPLEM